MKERASRTNSTSGTLRTKVSPFLSAQDICTIVDICARRRVVKLQFGPLLLEFEPAANKRNPTSAPGPAKPEATEEVIRAQTTIENNALESEELRTREDQIAELWITDPLKAEEMLANGELDPSDEGESEDGIS